MIDPPRRTGSGTAEVLATCPTNRSTKRKTTNGITNSGVNVLYFHGEECPVTFYASSGQPFSANTGPKHLVLSRENWKVLSVSRRKNVNRNIIVVRKVKVSKFFCQNFFVPVLRLLSHICIQFLITFFRVGMHQDLKYVLQKKI